MEEKIINRLKCLRKAKPKFYAIEQHENTSGAKGWLCMVRGHEIDGEISALEWVLKNITYDA